MNLPRVFISATSHDLGSYRKAVADVLVTSKVRPEVQDFFGPDSRTIRRKIYEAIAECDAVICLVGNYYGREPADRSDGEDRRSYTQMEYENAVELSKPIFVFLATPDCPVDQSNAPGNDDLRALQVAHIERIEASGRIINPFRSLVDLIRQVALIRFDRESLERGLTSRLTVLLSAELLDTMSVRSQEGEPAWARDVVSPFQALLRPILVRWGGAIQEESFTRYQVNFDSAEAAVNAALELHHAVRCHEGKIGALGLRIGIDMGQVIRFGGIDEGRRLQAGQGLVISGKLMQNALAGQTLMTRAVFNVAREHVSQVSFDSKGSSSVLAWQDHGRYLITGCDEPVEICEVGIEGEASLAAPAESDEIQRADSLDQRKMQGWRPAVGQRIPGREGWLIERKLGEGGFGEVWAARHAKLRELVVFKFCFDAIRLSSLRRELTLFRLLRETLGDRPDIARLREIRLEEAPYYLESEYIEGGNLYDWSKSDHRLTTMPLAERLRLVACIARTAAAAHSVGVIHKDLKPSNIFMRQGEDGRWYPILADFGIGAVVDRSIFEQRGITAKGFSHSLLEPGSSRTGTRMYQPPEASHTRTATVQGDVYALGVILFQMVIGDLDQPIGVGWENLLDSLDTRESRSNQGEIRDRYTVELLKNDVNDCVQVDIEKRLSSAAEMAERLEKLADRAADLKARSKAERDARRMRRFRIAFGTSVVALLVVGIFAAAAVIQWRRAASNEVKAIANETLAISNAAKAIRNERLAIQNAMVANSRRIATLATTNLDGQLDRALLLGAEAVRHGDTIEARDALLQALHHWPAVRRFLHVGASNYIERMRFSPDGRTVAAALIDFFPGLRTTGRVAFWDARTQARVGPDLEIPADNLGVNFSIDISFSPDGKSLAAAYTRYADEKEGGGVIVWDVATRRRIGRELEIPDGRVTDLSFGNNSKILAAQYRYPPPGAEDLFDSSLFIHVANPRARLWYARRLGVTLWDLTSQERWTPDLNSGQSILKCAALNPDGTTLAVGIAPADPKTNPLAQDLDPDAPEAHPSDKAIPRGIALWDVKSRKQLGTTLDFPEGPPTALSFSPDGQVLAMGFIKGAARSTKNGIAFWQVATRTFSIAVEDLESPVFGLSFNPTGLSLVAESASEDLLVLPTRPSGLRKIAFRARSPSRDPVNMSLSPAGNLLAFSDSDPDGTTTSVNLWSGLPQDSTKPWSLPTPGMHVGGLAISPDGKTMAVALNGSSRNPGFHTILFCDVNILRYGEADYRGGRGHANCLLFSPDGRWLASDDPEVNTHHLRLWDVAHGDREGVAIKVVDGFVHWLAFSQDSSRLAIGFWRRAQNNAGVLIWDVATRRPIGTPLEVTEGSIQSIAFRPDGKALLVGTSSADRKACGLIGWDVTSGQRRVKAFDLQGLKLECMAFSPEGRVLAIGTNRRDEEHGGGRARARIVGNVSLWDTARTESIGDPLRIPGGVRSMTLAADGGSLAAITQMIPPDHSNPSVVLMDLPPREPRSTIFEIRDGYASALAFDRQGKTLAAGLTLNHSLTTGGIALWDVQRRERLLSPLKLDQGTVSDVAWSPDGQTLATWCCWLNCTTSNLTFLDVGLQACLRRAGRIVNRNFTSEEWREYFPDEPYRLTFPEIQEPPGSSR